MTSIRDHHEAEGCEVEFRFYRKDAKQTWLVGEFTGWQKGRLAMDRLEDGWWILSVPLAPGDYRFRYVTDEAGSETWFTDFASHGVEYASGQWNSVVAVPEGRSAATSHKQRGEKQQGDSLPSKTKKRAAIAA